MQKITILGLAVAISMMSCIVSVAEAGPIPSPYQQVRDGTPVGAVVCAGDRMLMLSPSSMPACVFAGSVEVLERRGFVLLSEVPRDDLSAKQPGASEKAGGIGSPDASKTGDRPFVTTWRTASPNEPITIPVGGAAEAYTVDWGDGSTSANVAGDQSHAYKHAGTYTVTITGDFERIYLNNNSTNAPKLKSIEQWGDVSWTSMESAFDGASNMVYNAADVPDLSGVTDMSRMFAGAISFDGDLSGWDVSEVTDMSRMFAGGLVGDVPSGDGISSAPTMSFYVRVPFYYDSSFNGDISGWDVSRVTDMSGMFQDATLFNGDLSSWEVSSVRDMSGMFSGAGSFNGDLSSWEVSSVLDMSEMFHGVNSFNSNLSSWDVSSVTSMRSMFLSANSFNGDLSTWDVSEVTDMGRMFSYTRSFNGDLSTWDVSSVTSMGHMFYHTRSFNGDLSTWDVSRVTDMSGMFQDASRFNGDLSTWDVSRVTDMSGMFRDASIFNGDISEWDISSVLDMTNMFADASIFNGDISEWDVSSVTSMHQMFLGASAFNGDISEWDVSGVTGMSGMFAGATSFNGDLSEWDVSSVTEMSNMFSNADSFNGDLSSWDVSSVRDMLAMFRDADSFNGNISAWDVSSVFRTSHMFYEADSFNGDLSSWDVSNVTDMLGMFHDASSFDQNLGNWYIVFDNTSADIVGGTGVIGTITAQNAALDRQNPIYRIGSGADSDLFEIDGAALKTKPSTDYSGKTEYAVNITSTGDFGTNNFRMVDVTVTGAGADMSSTSLGS